MLQTMQMQEDLYDMCSDCFKHLALAVDNLSVELRRFKRGKEPGPCLSETSQEEAEQQETPQEPLGRQAFHFDVDLILFRCIFIYIY